MCFPIILKVTLDSAALHNFKSKRTRASPDLSYQSTFWVHLLGCPIGISQVHMWNHTYHLCCSSTSLMFFIWKVTSPSTHVFKPGFSVIHSSIFLPYTSNCHIWLGVLLLKPISFFLLLNLYFTRVYPELGTVVASAYAVVNKIIIPSLLQLTFCEKDR